MGSGTAEGKCDRYAKYMLIVFNIVFCFIGAALIGVGTYAYIQLKDYKQFFSDTNIAAPATVLILFGCFTFIVAGIGCLGAFKESPCLLFAFAGTIGFLLVTEMACGAVAFVFRADLQEFVTEDAIKLMKGYNESIDNSFKEAWDLMHDTLECCGAGGRNDWMNKSIATQQNGLIPSSCKNYTNGCIESFVDFANDKVIMIGAAAVGFGTIQMFGIVLACILGCAARKASNS